ncbi:MAG: ribonuclease E/G [Planctomycetota bacterium]
MDSEARDAGADEPRSAKTTDSATGQAGEGADGGGSKRRLRRRRTTRERADGSATSPPSADAANGSEKTGEGRTRRRRRRRTPSSSEPARGAAAPAGEAAGEAAAGGAGAATDGGADGAGRKRRRRRRTTKKDSAAEPDAKASDSSRAREEREGGSHRRRDRRSSSDKKRSSSDKRRSSRSRDEDGRRGRRDGAGRDRRGGSRRDYRDAGEAIEIVPRAPDPSAAPSTKMLLINAREREEARIALVVDGRLEEVFIELPGERSSAGNIYRGRIQNVERGIGAAFVDLGRGVTGFLHATDVPLSPHDDPDTPPIERLRDGDEVVVQVTRDSIGRKGPALTGRISLPGRYLVLMPHAGRSGISRRIPHGKERERVRRLLKSLEVPEGMGVIVRTASETTDAAALQADLGHLVQEWERIQRRAVEPGAPGVLRGESDIAERSVRDIMPPDVTRIVVDNEEIAGQVHRLLKVWYPSEAAAVEAVGHADARRARATREAPAGEVGSDLGTEASEAAAAAHAEEAARTAPAGVPPEADGFGDGLGARPDVREDAAPSASPSRAEGSDDEGGAAEDFEADFEEEVADDEDAADDAAVDTTPEESPEQRLDRLRARARHMPEVEIHTDAMPLFHAYGIETQLEDAYRRSARLPSGGSIVIDPTEALVAIDVNSGRLTDEADPESTALVTNLEAVEEAARQLRLRDLGGIVVIDFIDMRQRSSRRKVEKALEAALSRDRARIRLGRMGPFGLIVLSRQRIRQALARATHEVCDDCGGTGRRRSAGGTGLRIVREVQARIARSRGRGGLEIRAPADVVIWLKKYRSQDMRALARTCSGPLRLEVDEQLARDAWAMKGLPPRGESE